jgi:hypothetical protein
VIEFDLLDPVCVDDFPFIDYAVSGDVDAGARATIEISDIDGVVVQTLVDQPLSGRVIWPGASVDPPDWPGWVLDDDGVWVEDPTDAVLRKGLTFTVSVNPFVSDNVAYPPATPTCEAEPIVAPALIPVVREAPNVRPPRQVTTTTPTALPVTGPGHTSTLALIAAAVTACGCVLYSVRRRPTE